MSISKVASMLKNIASRFKVGTRSDKDRSVTQVFKSLGLAVALGAASFVGGVVENEAQAQSQTQNVRQGFPGVNDQVRGTPARVVRVTQKTDQRAAAIQRSNNRFARQIRSSTQRNVSRRVRDAAGGGDAGRFLGQLAGAITSESINTRRNTTTPKYTELTVEIDGLRQQYIMDNPGPYNYYRGQSVILVQSTSGNNIAVPQAPRERLVIDERSLPNNMRPR